MEKSENLPVVFTNQGFYCKMVAIDNLIKEDEFGGGEIMGKIIDMCGNPLDFDTVTDFRIVNVEYIYQPSYQESIYYDKRMFSKPEEKRLVRFFRMEPYGVVLGKYQSISLDEYYDEKMSLDDVIKQQFVIRAFNVIDSVGNAVNDLIRHDVIEDKASRIRRPSGVVVEKKLSEIPIKVYYSDGQIADLPKNSAFLGNENTPKNSAILTVPALLIKADHPIVVYGNGIDFDNEKLQAAYQVLLGLLREKTEKLEQEKNKQGSPFQLPKFDLPKIEIPPVNLQLPNFFGGKAVESSETEEKMETEKK